MRPDTLFIVNPNAGRRDVRNLLRELKSRPSDLSVRQTEYPGHGHEMVRDELDNYDVFVSVGGDGTVNEVASALVGTGKRFAALPFGSGNGFAREMGFSKDLARLLLAIEKGGSIETDVLRLNGRLCVNVAGVGFDSAVAHRFSESTQRGFWSYVAETLKAYWRFRPFDASIEFDGQSVDGRFFMVSIANTRQFGSNAIISPRSRPTDGESELVLVSPFPLWRLPAFLVRLFSGSLRPSKYIQFASFTHQAHLTTSTNELHIDGEPVRLDSPVKIQIEKKALLVVDTGRGKKRVS